MNIHTMMNTYMYRFTFIHVYTYICVCCMIIGPEEDIKFVECKIKMLLNYPTNFTVMESSPQQTSSMTEKLTPAAVMSFPLDPMYFPTLIGKKVHTCIHIYIYIYVLLSVMRYLP